MTPYDKQKIRTVLHETFYIASRILRWSVIYYTRYIRYLLGLIISSISIISAVILLFAYPGWLTAASVLLFLLATITAIVGFKSKNLRGILATLLSCFIWILAVGIAIYVIIVASKHSTINVPAPLS